MVRMDDHTISLGTLIACLALMATGVGAWVDVKSDITGNSTSIEANKDSNTRIENRLERIEDKVDRLIESMLKEQREAGNH